MATPLFHASIVGRAIAETLAHEVDHQLLGRDTGGEKRLLRCHDRLPSSLMNKAGERSFLDRTGILIKPTPYSSAVREDFPAKGWFEDHGAEAVNRLSPEGHAVLDRIPPVPGAVAVVPPARGEARSRARPDRPRRCDSRSRQVCC